MPHASPPQEPPQEPAEERQAATATATSTAPDGSLTSKKLRKLRQTYERRGVVYVSRIPPHMKPQKLRQLLQQYGEIGRVYCAPEDPLLRKQRKRKGGNTGKNFTEGWVEFEDKAAAKSTAAMLNGNPIGGKRRSAYHYDLWSLKYLSKFKWDHLTEEITYQRAVREQKLANEISAAKRERDFYMGQVDKAKGIEAMTERKRKRAEAEAEMSVQQAGHTQQQHRQEDSSQAPADASILPGKAAAVPDSKHRKALRSYGQKQAKADPAAGGGATLPSDFLALVGGSK